MELVLGELLGDGHLESNEAGFSQVAEDLIPSQSLELQLLLDDGHLKLDEELLCMFIIFRPNFLWIYQVYRLQLTNKQLVIE